MKDSRLERAGVAGFNKPKKTPGHPSKSHIVVAKEGDKGEISSKRVVGIVGALILFGTMAHNSLSPEDIAPSKDLVSAVEFVVIACLGFTSIDKFARKENAEG